MKTAKITMELLSNNKTRVTISLSAREAEAVESHIKEWTTYIMWPYTLQGIEINGTLNDVYTHEEAKTGLTKVLEGLGYEVRS